MIKKVISLGLTIATIVGVMISSAVSAEAKTTIVNYYSKNMKTYSTYVYGEYSRMYASPGYTGIMSTTSSYEDSYKRVYYHEYKEVDGDYILYHTYNDAGTDDVVISNIKKTVDGYVANRFHVGYIHLTSSSSSSVKDSLYCDIYKDTKENINY